MPRLFVAACVLVLASLCQNAIAQKYPVRPIRMVVPFSAGSTLDSMARLITQKLGEDLQQQIIVDNRDGAGGVIGSALVAKATPDGYTLLMGNVGPLAISPGLLPKMPYDLNDFAPITLTTTGNHLMVVTRSLPAASLKEFIAVAKAKPGQINFASSGYGSGLHLSAELLKHLAGIDIVHVPYKGSPQAFPDLVWGRVHMMFNGVTTLLPFVQKAQLKPLVWAAEKRTPLLPDVPTGIESGFPGLVTGSWHGILAPAGTPKAIVNQLNRSLIKTLSTPDVQEKFAAGGLTMVGNSPEEFAKYLRQEKARWEKLIKAAGLTGTM